MAGPGEAKGWPAGRLLAAVAATAAVSAASGALLSGSSGSAPPPAAVRVAVWLGSGLLYAAVGAPLARRAAGSRRERFLALLVPFYLTGAVSDLLEGYFYSTQLSGPKLVAALVVELVPVSLIALAIVTAIPVDPALRDGPGVGESVRRWLRERPAGSWTWRVLVAGLPYALVYEFFATLVTPIEHRFYSDPAFVASLHTRTPPAWVTLLLEAGRGVLFVLAAVPVLALFRGSRPAAFLQVAAIGAVVEAYVPLLGRTDWPAAMRWGNVLELTGDSAVRAAIMVLLLALPAAAVGRDGGHGSAPARRPEAQVPSAEGGARPAP